LPVPCGGLPQGISVIGLLVPRAPRENAVAAASTLSIPGHGERALNDAVTAATDAASAGFPSSLQQSSCGQHSSAGEGSARIRARQVGRHSESGA